jgi:XapX domain-containing protein
MTGYLVSLLMGLAVGVAYGLVHVRSPAPPLIALVGLLGMVLGEQAIEAVGHHFVSLAAQTPVRQVTDDTRGRTEGTAPAQATDSGRSRRE